MFKGNKKYFIFSLIVFSVIILIVVYGRIFVLNSNTYQIKAVFDPEEKTVLAVQKTIYINKSDVVFSNIYFHLYPNAFKSENTTPFFKNELYKAYPSGFAQGYIDIRTVKVNGKKVNYSIEGIDKSILNIRLPNPLESGKHVDLEFSYVVKFPPSIGRFGYGNNTYNVTNWYPIACVYDNKGWHKDPYYILGDPFYSDVSNYRVNIKTPKDYIVATTGNIVNSKIDSNGKEWIIDAKKVRDFAMVISNKFKVISEKMGDVTVNSYYFTDDDFGRRALKYGKDALEFFSDYIGEYPYKQYSVVQADFYVGGMEYPNLVMIDKGLYTKANIFNLEYVIAHETAHQWWYALVGNDEVNESWLDEGLTEYSTILYLESFYGKKVANSVLQTAIEKPFEQYRSSKGDTNTLKSLSQFKDWDDYTNLVYNKGALIYSGLRKLIGDNKFREFLKAYYNTYKYKNATTQDLIDVATKVFGKDLGGYFQEWLY